jgi:hypothetical protein
VSRGFTEETENTENTGDAENYDRLRRDTWTVRATMLPFKFYSQFKTELL